MASPDSRFAGGDQRYLREEQYRDSTRLRARADLHRKYRVSPVGWFHWELPYLELAEGATVLEVGCGAGWIWEEAADLLPSDVALTLSDLSPGMLAEATTRAGATGRFASVTAQLADLQELPFPDSSFHRVLCNHMLYHLPDPARGVAELARVVRPDGLVLVATNGRHNMIELGEIRHQVFGTGPTRGTVEAFGVETGFPMLRECFDFVFWRQLRSELRCTDPEDVLAYLTCFLPGEDATDAERAALVAAVDRAFTLGNGVLVVQQDVGCFACTNPR